MKNKIKRRLQIRFVIISSAALILLLAVIAGTSIWLSYRQLFTTADRLIKMTDTEPDSPELEGARYFSVVFHTADRTMDVDLTHTSLVREKAATEYARKIIDDKSDKGFIDSYRYLVRHRPQEIKITFLSRQSALNAFESNRTTLLIVSAVGCCLMIGILAAVSGAVVSPLVKNRQKQKEFITSASHELKTPLTVINADAQLLESEIGENEWLSDIVKQTNAMGEMTHRLVYLARAEEQDHLFVKIDFPISDLAFEIAESYLAVAQSNGKSFSADIEKDLSYCGDEKAIRELLTALLDNAFKYSSEKGDIALRLVPEGKGVRIVAENSVSEITEEQIKNFGERFYRADTSSKVKGFGIGLSVVDAVAKAHKGKLVAELPEKERIRFTVSLK